MSDLDRCIEFAITGKDVKAKATQELAELRANNEKLSTEVRKLQITLDKALADVEKLTNILNDWSELYRKIIGDGGCPDEVHCACVPALREEIKRREKTEQERADLLEKTVGTTSLEHFIVRYKEMQDRLKELQL